MRRIQNYQSMQSTAVSTCLVIYSCTPDYGSNPCGPYLIALLFSLCVTHRLLRRKLGLCPIRESLMQRLFQLQARIQIFRSIWGYKVSQFLGSMSPVLSYNLFYFSLGLLIFFKLDKKCRSPHRQQSAGLLRVPPK